MQPLRSHRSLPARGGITPTLTLDAPMSTVIVYGASLEIAAECESVATEMHLARAEVKHLQAACTALKAHPRAFLVASDAVRPWDHQVLEEHAARAGATLRWVTSGREADDVGAAVRAGATGRMPRRCGAR